MAEATKFPALSVCNVFRTDMPTWVIVMVALGITAPLGSVTEPTMVPVSNCALATRESARTIPRGASRRRGTTGYDKKNETISRLFLIALLRCETFSAWNYWVPRSNCETGRMLTRVIRHSQSFLCFNLIKTIYILFFITINELFIERQMIRICCSDGITSSRTPIYGSDCLAQEILPWVKS